MGRNAFNGRSRAITDDLDYVYIDWNHAYTYALNDIETYWPLVSDGGVLAGHDSAIESMTQALIDFASEHNLQLHLEPYNSDWYFVKHDT
ncbi:class I SAM-dependent methyltransferase [Halonotius sp. GCM10025705]|uniref:class I SAM-dependent methyltransferase n=1 Tax=Halonotius sp. GCM10025705 TaxID=3252678 RepID=UPI00360A1703